MRDTVLLISVVKIAVRLPGIVPSPTLLVGVHFIIIFRVGVFMYKLRILNFVRYHRVRIGFTQSQLAQLVGVSKNTISSIECCNYHPSLNLAFLLCSALQVPIDKLFYYDRFDPDSDELPF